MAKYNDLDPNNWKEYDYINTDSLWLIDKRDNSGVHSSYYHGNFVPQIPRQLFLRYTKKGDWILDPFMGSGTSIIEAQRLHRNSIGVELQKNVAEEAVNRIKKERKDDCFVKVVAGDSRKISYEKILTSVGIKQIQFVILHPPYWDIIKFSKNNNDLSNSKTLEDFLESFEKIVVCSTRYLENNRYCACVIGDKYSNGQVVPLGYHCMNIFLKRGFILKAIIVKNFGETKGKLNQQGIWRYRAITNDFYIFKHEYIFIFKKVC